MKPIYMILVLGYVPEKKHYIEQVAAVFICIYTLRLNAQIYSGIAMVITVNHRIFGQRH